MDRYNRAREHQNRPKPGIKKMKSKCKGRSHISDVEGKDLGNDLLT